MAYRQERTDQREGGTKLEYKRFEIRRGQVIRHKLHGHICQVKRKHARGWAVFDTKNGDTHETAAHTIWRYYQPITN